MERNPDASGDADFKDPDIRQNRRGKFMPKIFLNETAPLDLQSCGYSMHFLLEFTPVSSSHSSPIRFHPEPCIGIRDSRDVILIYSGLFLSMKKSDSLYVKVKGTKKPLESG
jgi:hypothetical protein